MAKSSKNKPGKKKKKIEARQSEIHGNGVFATEAIAKGERIIRYKGALRTHDQVDADYGELEENGHTFLFTLNDDYVIDANIEGGVARWINHSCAPNCEAVVEEDDKGRPHRTRCSSRPSATSRPARNSPTTTASRSTSATRRS